MKNSLFLMPCHKSKKLGRNSFSENMKKSWLRLAGWVTWYRAIGVFLLQLQCDIKINIESCGGPSRVLKIDGEVALYACRSYFSSAAVDNFLTNGWLSCVFISSFGAFFRLSVRILLTKLVMTHDNCFDIQYQMDTSKSLNLKIKSLLYSLTIVDITKLNYFSANKFSSGKFLGLTDHSEIYLLISICLFLMTYTNLTFQIYLKYVKFQYFHKIYDLLDRFSPSVSNDIRPFFMFHDFSYIPYINVRTLPNSHS